MGLSVSVDRVMADQRAASFRTRSIKTESKLAALELALSMTDLTTLEGQDTPEKVRGLCRKAVRPAPWDEAVLGRRLPSVAAVCVYPSMVGVAAEALAGTGVHVASVATGFPSGQYPLGLRLSDAESAISMGADEIDMVINRGAFLAGRYAEVAQEVREVQVLCASRGAHLKVILETGELETYDQVRRASALSIQALVDGAREAQGSALRGPGDVAGGYIKTSTGKVSPAATMGVTLVMLEAIREHAVATGGVGVVGMKPAGGIRAAKDAVHYLVMVRETMPVLDRGWGGTDGEGAANPWLSPTFFRFGASSLVDDILRQLRKQATGSYAARYDTPDA